MALCACNHGDLGLAGTSAATIESSLAAGQTTEMQALARFGAPRTKASNNSGDTWTYYLWKDPSPTSPISYLPLIQLAYITSSTGTKQLNLLFDKSGILRGWDYTQTNVPRYEGL